MARRLTSSTPPVERMTPTRGMILLYILGPMLDFLKFTFTIFVFAAPLLVGEAVKVYLTTVQHWPVWIANLAALVLGGLTAVTEIAAAPIAVAIEGFGIIMALAIAFFGWLIIYTLLILWGIKPWGIRNMAKTSFGFLASMIPIANLFPTFTPTLWLVIRATRKEDAEARAKWEADNATKNAELEAQYARLGFEQERMAQINAELEAEQAAEAQANAQQEIPEAVA